MITRTYIIILYQNHAGRGQPQSPVPPSGISKIKKKALDNKHNTLQLQQANRISLFSSAPPTPKI